MHRYLGCSFLPESLEEEAEDKTCSPRAKDEEGDKYPGHREGVFCAWGDLPVGGGLDMPGVDWVGCVGSP